MSNRRTSNATRLMSSDGGGDEGFNKGVDIQVTQGLATAQAGWLPATLQPSKPAFRQVSGDPHMQAILDHAATYAWELHQEAEKHKKLSIQCRDASTCLQGLVNFVADAHENRKDMKIAFDRVKASIEAGALSPELERNLNRLEDHVNKLTKSSSDTSISRPTTLFTAPTSAKYKWLIIDNLNEAAYSRLASEEAQAGPVGRMVLADLLDGIMAAQASKYRDYTLLSAVELLVESEADMSAILKPASVEKADDAIENLRKTATRLAEDRLAKEREMDAELDAIEGTAASGVGDDVGDEAGYAATAGIADGVEKGIGHDDRGSTAVGQDSGAAAGVGMVGGTAEAGNIAKK